MGIFTKFIPSFLQRSTPANPEQWLIDYFSGGVDTESGVSVDEYNALTFSAVYACITLISETVASLPLIIYRKRADGGRERAIDHPLYPILHDAFNDEMTSFVFREVMQGHLLSWGNAYAHIKQNSLGKAESLSILPPDKVKPERAANGKIIYKYIQDTEKQYVSRQILHIPGFGFNGLIGKSPIAIARESIGLGLAAEQFGSKFFGNGANPGLIFEHPGKLGDEAHKRLRDSIAKAYSGLGNAHKALITEEGMKTTRTTIPPNDAQFLETRSFQKNEVCSIYRVPPHMIGDTEKSTSWGTGIEQQQIGFITHTIRPWLIRWEQEITRKMMTDADKKAGYYVEFLVDALLRGDSTARGEFYNKMFNIGALSINDIRKKENMNPIENGDKHFVPLNYIPLDQAGAAQLTESTTELKAIEIRGTVEQRSPVERDRISNRYVSLVRDAAQRTVDYEVTHIRKASGDLSEWVEGFYETMPEVVTRNFMPVLTAFAEAIAEAAGREIGFDYDEAELREFISGYVTVYVNRHVLSSARQLQKVLEEAKENAFEEMEQRADEWEETRAEKIARNETVRMSSGVAQSIFFAAGLASIWRIRGKSTCPYCKTLSGKKVRAGEAYFQSGDEVDPGGDNEPMKVRGLKQHPPLHAGCDCYISPI